MQCLNPQPFRSRRLLSSLNTCQFSSTIGLFFYDLKLTELGVLHEELPGLCCCKVAEVGQPWWSTSSELLVSNPCLIMLVLMKEDALSQRRVLWSWLWNLMLFECYSQVIWIYFCRSDRAPSVLTLQNQTNEMCQHPVWGQGHHLLAVCLARWA